MGDIWDVPRHPVSDYPNLTREEWREVEPLVVSGYRFKCKDACQIAGREFVRPDWLDAVTGKLADELGAPVQQAVTVVKLRSRTP